MTMQAARHFDPVREISDDERKDYARDGAVVLRQVLPLAWIDRMRIAIDRAVAAPSDAAMSLGGSGTRGRYLGDFFIWQRDADFRNLALSSPLVDLAQQMMRSETVTFFYDQLLVKEPDTPDVTPWHQDLPYWPVKGNDILSLWVPFDSVSVESGAMHYVKGSHLAGTMYAPTPFNKNSDYSDLYRQSGLPEFPDIDAVLAQAELLICDVEPGDVVVHHPLTFHWSPGNLHAEHRRRALALRYLGDDAVFDDRPGTFIQNPKVAALLYEPINYVDGERLGPPNFPVVWPSRVEAQ